EQLELLDRTGREPLDSEYWPWATPSATAGPERPAGSAPHGYSPAVVDQLLSRATRDDYPDWQAHVRAAAGCSHPIRLEGQIHVTRDGQTVATYSTDAMPDGAIYTTCGNRRHTVCSS